MKRIGIIIFFLTFFFSAKAQLWIEAGGKAMYGFKGFYNDNIINDRDHLYRLNGSLAYGAVVNFNFSDDHGLSAEWLIAQNEQLIAYTALDEDVDNLIKWKTHDIYLLYQAYFNSSFVEIGPKISLVNSVEQTFNEVDRTTDNLYADQYYSAVAGFGGYVAGSEVFSLKMGLRFEYAISDFVTEEGGDNGYPAFYSDYEAYKGTHPFSASVYLELKFPLGKLSQAECGRRQFVFGTRR